MAMRIPSLSNQKNFQYHWEQVKEQHITNEMVRREFEDIPSMDAFIAC